jgi:hypothetical protein
MSAIAGHRRSVALGISMLVGPSWAWAQATATTGQIEGTVTDHTGAALAGASVTARNLDTGFERRAVSGSTGLYRLVLLPLGRYQLVADLAGFAAARTTDLVLRVGQTVTVNLSLQLAAATMVEVTAGASPVEVTRSLPATTLDERAIATLPINGRRFEDFVFLTPGTVPNQYSGRPVIGGQRGIHAAYVVDGASYDNPFFGGIRGGERAAVIYTISQEAIQEFQVTNAGYSAEFGRSGGGVVNAVTKSGTNELRGSAFWYFRDESLTADDPYGRPPTDFSQHQFGASLSGPIRKDKVHFLAVYDQQLQRLPFTVKFASDPTGIPGFEGKEGRFTQTNDVWTALGRVDWRLNDASHLSARYNWSRNLGKNGLSSGVTDQAVETSSLEKDLTHTAVAQLSTVLSPTALNEARFEWSHEDRPREPNTTLPSVQVAGLGGIGRTFFLPALETDERFQLVDNFTRLRGRHAFRFGLDLNLTHTQQPFFLVFSGGLYLFGSPEAYQATLETGEQGWFGYLQGFGRSSVDLWQQEYAFYAQDTWKLRGDLTLHYGLRYEAQIQPQPDAPNPELAGSDRIPSDTNNFAPRVGLSWDPWKDGRGVVRANAGLFYARTMALPLVAPFTSNGIAQLQLFFLPFFPGAPTYPGVLAAPPPAAVAPPTDVNVVDAGFQNPRTFQASLGIEREVLRGLVLGVDLVHARMHQLPRLLDTNLAPASGVAPDGRRVYGDPRPDPRFQRILRLESSARGTYDALTLSARRLWAGGDHWFNRGLQFQAYYTLAKTRDDDSDEVLFAGVSYQDWDDLAQEYTASDNDVRHAFKLNGTWRLAGGVEVGVVLVASSGLPYTQWSAEDLNLDGSFSDRRFVDGRDTGRNGFRQPSFRSLDIRVMKALDLGRNRRLELAADLFNALDSENRSVSNANRIYTENPNVGVPDAQAGAPRTAQFSLRFRF